MFCVRSVECLIMTVLCCVDKEWYFYILVVEWHVEGVDSYFMILIHPFRPWFFLLNNHFIFTEYTFHGLPHTSIHARIFVIHNLYISVHIRKMPHDWKSIAHDCLPLHTVELFLQPPADPLRIQDIPPFCNQITLDQVLSEMGIGECMGCLEPHAPMCPNRVSRPLSTAGISNWQRILKSQHFSRVNNHPVWYPAPSSVGEEWLVIVWTWAWRIKTCFMSCSQANTYVSETHSTTVLATTMEGFNSPTI